MNFLKVETGRLDREARLRRLCDEVEDESIFSSIVNYRLNYSMSSLESCSSGNSGCEKTGSVARRRAEQRRQRLNLPVHH